MSMQISHRHFFGPIARFAGQIGGAPRCHLGPAILLFATIFSLPGQAQTAVSAPLREKLAPDASSHTAPLSLPDDPSALLPGSGPSDPGALPQTAHQAPVTISGVVTDRNGGLVPGAHISAVAQNIPGEHDTTADPNGFFSFTGLPAGTYTITITSSGLQTYILRDIRLKPGGSYALPKTDLPIARTSADVTVTLTEEQVAETQLNAELKQRVFGVFPNFYTTFDWNAAPLSARQKMKLSGRALIDPVEFLTTAGVAGAEQYNNTFPEYGRGFAGYSRRYGAAYGDFVLSHTMGSVVFASLLHQDPRYFVMGTGTKRQRTWHALSSAVMQRGDNRRWQPAYSNFLGNATTGLIASTYHPGTSTGQLVLSDSLIGIGGRAVDNLVREFILRRLTSNIPADAQGKPPQER